MFTAYLFVQAYVGPQWGAVASAGVALVFLGAYVQRPQTLEAWRIGAEAERKTARYLDGLAEAGCIVLHDRKVPGYGGNLDHVAVGPTGVWAIETKNLAGKVVIEDDSCASVGIDRTRSSTRCTARRQRFRLPSASHWSGTASASRRSSACIAPSCRGSTRPSAACDWHPAASSFVSSATVIGG
jgi:hypothetical protein